VFISTRNQIYLHFHSIACHPGTYGLNCTKSCPVGFFGALCGGQCVDCPPDDCRPDYGCPNSTNGN
jgi:hypothetical protein